MAPDIDKKIISGNFSKNAVTYEDHAAVQKNCAEKLIDMIELDYFPRILEIGCGTGVYTRMLLERYPDAQITAIDISGEMVSLARERTCSKRVNFEVSDGECIRQEKKFDLITSNASFQWFQDLDRSFSCFAENLSAGGVLCFSMYGPQTFREFKEVLGVHMGPRQWLSSSRFAEKDEVRRCLERYFKDFELKEENYKVDFFSIWDFLQNIKKSGARGEGLGGAFIGKYAIREMEKTYIDKFGLVTATHHIYFCRGSFEAESREIRGER
jgi:malonyl-CoA O-methyltransferase